MPFDLKSPELPLLLALLLALLLLLLELLPAAEFEAESRLRVAVLLVGKAGALEVADDHSVAGMQV